MEKLVGCWMHGQNNKISEHLAPTPILDFSFCDLIWRPHRTQFTFHSNLALEFGGIVALIHRGQPSTLSNTRNKRRDVKFYSSELSIE